jgi:hypothetical protein
MSTTDDHFHATGSSFVNIGFTAWSVPPTSTPLQIGVWGLGRTNGVFGLVDDGSMLPTVAIPAADSYAIAAGVLGAANTSTGVAGMANAVGVFGQNGNAPGLSTGRRCGVLGASVSATGVVGESSAGTGVLGSTGGTAPMRPGLVAGVIGTGNQNIGVVGESLNGTGVLGTTGQNAPMLPNLVAGVIGSGRQHVGVFGMSIFDVGVLGYSPGVNGVGGGGTGILGSADGDGGVAVAGFATGPNGRAVVGQAIAAGAKAGDFRGNVDISRALTVGGTLTATVKNAIVPFPDGTTRLMHCMESPEHWFEDFGTARLKQGRAVVKLDADFAKTIKARDYRVFLTPEGDCGGLYIRNRRSASFEVRELQGGASSVAFSYRIVGRRKDIRKHRRFDKFVAQPPVPPAALARTPVDALLAKVRKQARATPVRAGRRKTARGTQRLSTLLARVRKQARANAARNRKRGKSS